MFDGNANAERQRERDRERETERETERQREETDRETERQRERDREMRITVLQQMFMELKTFSFCTSKADNAMQSVKKHVYLCVLQP